jgi:hypothetical protein
MQWLSIMTFHKRVGKWLGDATEIALVSMHLIKPGKLSWKKISKVAGFLSTHQEKHDYYT